MRIRQLLIATASLGFLLDGVSIASAAFGQPDAARPAGQWQKACADAGAATAAECEALQRKGKGGSWKASPAAPAEPAAAKTPPETPAADQDTGAADRKPAPRRVSPPPDAGVAPPAAVVTPPAPEKSAVAPADQPPAAGADHRPHRSPAVPVAPAAPAAVAPPPVAPAADGAAVPEGKPRAHDARLPKDCLAAGIQSKADCDALHAEKPGGQPGASIHEAPPPPATPTAPVAPAASTTIVPPANNAAAPGGEPRVHGTHLPKDCLAAGIQSKADCDAFHAEKPGALPPPAATPAPPAATPAPTTAPLPGQRPPHKLPAGSAATAPAVGAPQSDKLTPPGILPQPAGSSEAAPAGIPPQLVAPLFDSAKDAETNDGATIGAPARSRPPHQRPPRPAGPAPATDEAAQTGIHPPAIQPIDKTQGQQIDPDANQVGLQLPPGARVVQPSTDDRFRPGGPGDYRGPRPGAPGGRTQGGPDFAGGQHAAPDPLGLALGTILQLGNQLIINSPGQDQRRIAGGQGDRSNYERLPDDRYRETVTRPNGIRIVTIYDQSGDVLRRSRFDQDGRETVLAYFDARQDSDLNDWRDPGDDLPPLQPDIAPQDYVLDADQASESQVQRFFAQPPVEQVQRLYSIDEVKRSARIRDMVRRLEIGDLTFDTGAATIAEDQVQNLANVAQAMLGLLQRNPAETFLIEGHTDAVGSDISNLQLSDARAATVAEILTDFYHIPPENLVTQGYGERFLIVQTDGPERLNRRVTIRRITPLITVASQPY